jgi:cytidylate kinase
MSGCWPTGLKMTEQANNVPVITVDGPGGSGKGTIAMQLAQKLGWHFLDSGALYRLVAVAAIDRDIGAESETALGKVAENLDVNFGISNDGMVILLDGNYITGRLRSEQVSVFASKIAAFPVVRAALVHRQRAFRKPPGLVADGRDMGTVIFPDAILKIFLTATAEARAQRRYKQLKEKGESVNLTRLFQDIKQRDERDSTRAIAPLRPAKDAHVIDSTELSINQVLQKIQALLEKPAISI